MTDDYKDEWQEVVHEGDGSPNWGSDPALDVDAFRKAVDEAVAGNAGGYDRLGDVLDGLQGRLGNLPLRLAANEVAKALAGYVANENDADSMRNLQKWLPRLGKEVDVAGGIADEPVWAWAGVDERPEWLVDWWIPRAMVTSFYADPGSGKSYIALQLACALATPGYRPWLEADVGADGIYVDRDCKVLLGSREDSLGTVSARVERIGMPPDGRFGFKDLMAGGPIWGRAGRFDPPALTANGFALLNRAVREEVGLLIVDSLSTIYEGDEIDRAEVSRFLVSMNAWCRETDIAMLIVAHLPKGGEARQSGYSGSTAWHGGVRHSLLLDSKKDRERGDYKELSVSKTNLCAPPPVVALDYDKEKARFCAIAD